MIKRLILIFAVSFSLTVSAAEAQNDASPPSPQVTDSGETPLPSEDIRDIYGPVDFHNFAAVAGKTALALGAVALVASLLFLLSRWRRKETIPVKSPEELALEALTAAKMLMQPDLSREFAFSVSGILRQYILARYQVAATSETTEEFLYRLSENNDSPLGKHYILLTDFLSICDAAKFARASFSLDSLEKLLESARHFIEASRPVPVEAA